MCCYANAPAPQAAGVKKKHKTVRIYRLPHMIVMFVVNCWCRSCFWSVHDHRQRWVHDFVYLRWYVTKCSHNITLQLYVTLGDLDMYVFWIIYVCNQSNYAFTVSVYDFSFKFYSQLMSYLFLCSFPVHVFYDVCAPTWNPCDISTPIFKDYFGGLFSTSPDRLKNYWIFIKFEFFYGCNTRCNIS